jgi:phosphatidylinositol alpha-mannosyltransferase
VERWRSVEPVKADGPTIFFCSRHEPRKGLEVLLEALQRLPGEVRCWVGSDGPDTARLRSRYAGDPRIEWLGRLSEHDKVARMRGADVFCAPSLGGESFGVVLLEAMAAGTPVVASDIDGYRTVATDELDALLPPPGDPEALAAALRRVLGRPADAAALVAAGGERAERWSMTALAGCYEELYDWVRRRGPGAAVDARPSGLRSRRRWRR